MKAILTGIDGNEIVVEQDKMAMTGGTLYVDVATWGEYGPLQEWPFIRSKADGYGYQTSPKFNFAVKFES